MKIRDFAFNTKSARWCVRTWERRGTLSGFLLGFVKERQTAVISLSFTVACVNSNSSFLDRRESRVYPDRAPLRSTTGAHNLDNKVTVFVRSSQSIWSICKKGVSRRLRPLVKLIEGVFGIQHKRVDGTLSWSHRKNKNKHNRILAQPIIPAVSRKKGERKRYR